jgi:formylglycine-generating enzyme required for sulfatase activity
MGSPVTEDGHREHESPVRHVRISNPFYLGRYEVTQLQYREIMGKKLTMRQGDSLPVDDMSFPGALAYCQALSERTGLRVTLPTEAQWEYACRAGTKTRYYSGEGEDDLDKVGWYRENAGSTSHPVGKKQPNPWGLYDMLGNVWEPCLDSLPNYATIPEEDPRGSVRDWGGSMRGGGWMHPADYCRAAKSIPTDPMFGGLGIRIAINCNDERKE